MTELRAQVIVVPNTLATNDGNSFNTSPSGAGSVRWLQIHDASQFGVLSGPSFLTQFAYRPDGIVGQSGPRSFTLRIYASTTSRTVAGISTTFAENPGTNNMLVFDGTVNVTTGNLPGPGNTRQFDYVFPFTTPFLYDPAAGNLVLDLQIQASGSAVTFDTVSGDPAIGRVFSFGSSTATTGDLRASHVTQLTFEPLTPIESWRQAYFGSPASSGNGADSADPDYDGLSNLLEFSTAGSPIRPGAVAAAGTRTGNVIEFTYTRNKAAMGAVQFTVEWSDSLSASSWSGAGVTETILNDDGSVQQVKATVPAGTGNRLFVRLRVSASP